MNSLEKALLEEREAARLYRRAVLSHRGQKEAMARWNKAKAIAMKETMDAAKKKAESKPDAWRCNICGCFVNPPERKPDHLCHACRDALCGNGFAGVEYIPAGHVNFPNANQQAGKTERLTRAKILDQASKMVCGHREQDYGSPENNFTRIAALWSAYLQRDVTAIDVACLMVLLKVVRAKSSPMKADNFIDMAGYAACGGEIGQDRI